MLVVVGVPLGYFTAYQVMRAPFQIWKPRSCSLAGYANNATKAAEPQHPAPWLGVTLRYQGNIWHVTIYATQQSLAFSRRRMGRRILEPNLGT